VSTFRDTVSNTDNNSVKNIVVDIVSHSGGDSVGNIVSDDASDGASDNFIDTVSNTVTDSAYDSVAASRGGSHTTRCCFAYKTKIDHKKMTMEQLIRISMAYEKQLCTHTFGVGYHSSLTVASYTSIF